MVEMCVARGAALTSEVELERHRLGCMRGLVGWEKLHHQQ